MAGKLVQVGLADPVVFALPRGGVPVAVPVAERLQAPLDIILVRKIGAPGHEEFAIGAVVDGDEPDVVWNDEALVFGRVSSSDRQKLVSEKLAEIDQRRASYLGGRPQVPVSGKDAIVIDDGIATGATVKAALKALRRRDPRSVTLAIPVAAREFPGCDPALCGSPGLSFRAGSLYCGGSTLSGLSTDGRPGGHQCVAQTA